MTEFEQEVANALWQATPAVIGPMPTQEEIVREWLAPRVAAAIEMLSSMVMRTLEDRYAGQQVALRILRGQADD